MSVVKVTKIGDIKPGKMIGVDVKGERLLIANVGGKLFACGAVCTHSGGPLDEGDLNKDKVTCPWHGSIFDVKTGKVLGPPAKENIKSYKVTVKGKDVFVEV